MDQKSKKEAIGRKSVNIYFCCTYFVISVQCMYLFILYINILYSWNINKVDMSSELFFIYHFHGLENPYNRH